MYKYNEGTGGKFMADMAEMLNTLNYFRKNHSKNSVDHSISDAFWQKIENKIIMQDDRSYEGIKPLQRYYGESRLHHAVFKIRSKVRNKLFKKETPRIWPNRIKKKTKFEKDIEDLCTYE